MFLVHYSVYCISTASEINYDSRKIYKNTVAQHKWFRIKIIIFCITSVHFHRQPVLTVQNISPWLSTTCIILYCTLHCLYTVIHIIDYSECSAMCCWRCERKVRYSWIYSGNSIRYDHWARISKQNFVECIGLGQCSYMFRVSARDSSYV